MLSWYRITYQNFVLFYFILFQEVNPDGVQIEGHTYWLRRGLREQDGSWALSFRQDSSTLSPSPHCQSEIKCRIRKGDAVVGLSMDALQYWPNLSSNYSTMVQFNYMCLQVTSMEATGVWTTPLYWVGNRSICRFLSWGESLNNVSFQSLLCNKKSSHRHRRVCEM